MSNIKKYICISGYEDFQYFFHLSSIFIVIILYYLVYHTGFPLKLAITEERYGARHTFE